VALALTTNCEHCLTFSFEGGESAGTQKLLVPLPNNLPYPGKSELVQKLGNLDRTEFYMLKSDAV